MLPILAVLQLASSFGHSARAASAPAALPPVPQQDDRFGIVQAAESTDRAVQAGARWERFVFQWSAYQPNGPSDWSTSDPNLPGYVRDDLIASQIAAGITPVGVVLGTPGWAARDSSGSISPPKGLSLAYNDPNNTWGQFIAKLAARYKGRVDRWIIWNEPDQYGDGQQHTWTGSVADFYQLVKVADQAIKPANPSATVVVGGMTYWWDHHYQREQYLDSMLDVEAQDPTAASNGYYFDAVDVHTYSNPLNSYLAPVVFHQIMQKHGFDKPVWTSEMNVVPNDDPVSPQPNGPFRASMDQQASYMIEASALALAANVQRMSVYKMRDTGGEGSGELYGLVRDDGSLRPAYVAWQFAVRTFSGTDSAVYTWAGSDNPPTQAQIQALIASNTNRVQWIWPAAINQVVLHKGNLRITVVWNASNAPATASVQATGTNPTLYDKYGRQLPLPAPVNGAYQFALEPSSDNTDPRDTSIYLVGGSPMILVEDVQGGAASAPGASAAPAPGTPASTSSVASAAGSIPSTTRVAPAAADPSTQYFDATGHNVGGPFLQFYKAHGGLDIFGYPRTEAIQDHGQTVQYFQRARMELHPELAGTPYEISLTLLGDQVTADRRPFPTVAPFQNSADRVYFPQTKHSLSLGFLRYFNTRGGLDVFGYPTSEEIQEGGYTVQYFQRARFEYHPELAGTPYEVELGLLGDQVLRQMGALGQ